MRAYIALLFSLAIVSVASAQQGSQPYNPRPPRDDGGRYDDRRPDHRPHYDGRFDRRRFPLRDRGRDYSFQQQWFQRPYPYHLDYYRWKWGGSYAPYFGNLYGPPQVYAPQQVYAPVNEPSGAPPAGYDGYHGDPVPEGELPEPALEVPASNYRGYTPFYTPSPQYYNRVQHW